MSEVYKDYKIDSEPNEWGYFEGIDQNDCDAFILRDKTKEGLKDQIDEKTMSEVMTPREEYKKETGHEPKEETYVHGCVVGKDFTAGYTKWLEEKYKTRFHPFIKPLEWEEFHHKDGDVDYTCETVIGRFKIDHFNVKSKRYPEGVRIYYPNGNSLLVTSANVEEAKQKAQSHYNEKMSQGLVGGELEVEEIKRPINIIGTGEYLEPFSFESDSESLLFHSYIEIHNYVDALENKLSLKYVPKKRDIGVEIKKFIKDCELHITDENKNQWRVIEVSDIKLFFEELSLSPQPELPTDWEMENKFECFEIHPVQSRMYGCDFQCDECKKEESQLTQEGK